MPVGTDRHSEPGCGPGVPRRDEQVGRIGHFF
jgi:hypothetical protein